jgi:hypothetical protein
MVDNSETVLDDHRKMLTVSKNLSTFQLDNLKKWAFIAFDNVDNNTVSYSFIDGEDQFYAGRVVFKINLETDIDKEEKFKRSTFLADWTRVLFWTDTKVEVYVNDKRIINDI